MMLKILLGLSIIIVCILVFAATRPDTLVVQRSMDIAAPPAEIFSLINDFHHWPHWAPQDKEDPTMTRTYSGASHGVGAVSNWHGRGSTGRGQMEITQSIPDSALTVTTDFVKPFVAHNVNHFTLQSSGNITHVTWTLQGQNLYMMKLMGIFLDMDREAGKHFESGLQNLKTAAEK